MPGSAVVLLSNGRDHFGTSVHGVVLGVASGSTERGIAQMRRRMALAVSPQNK
jgi:hypothetical protein